MGLLILQGPCEISSSLLLIKPRVSFRLFAASVLLRSSKRKRTSDIGVVLMVTVNGAASSVVQPSRYYTANKLHDVTFQKTSSIN
jgi:hypothetical protein